MICENREQSTETGREEDKGRRKGKKKREKRTPFQHLPTHRLKIKMSQCAGTLVKSHEKCGMRPKRRHLPCNNMRQAPVDDSATCNSINGMK